ncbi:hypothetical protein LTR94_019981 [Friedmanniomyces endolithicus]|jgi:hypothetical protein|nr:hypothetical protein LTR94_019981 [Friedmanniomyces endolithicus]
MAIILISANQNSSSPNSFTVTKFKPMMNTMAATLIITPSPGVNGIPPLKN